MLTKSGLRTFLAVGAVVSLAACADSPTAARPTGAAASGGSRSVVSNPVSGKLYICKVAVNGANGVDFSFNVSYHNITAPSTEIGPSTVHVLSGDCALAAETDNVAGNAFDATITEQAPPQGWVLTGIDVNSTAAGNGPSKDVNSATASAVRFGNDGGSIVTFTNTFISGCNFTKGYYRNHATATAALIPATIHVGNADLTAAQAQAILNATPGKPGNITFSSNDLLNLVQQLISAILNGGNTGPQSVQDAITSANAHIFISGGKAITTRPSQTGIGSLITALSNFNEGRCAGFPHCGDD